MGHGSRAVLAGGLGFAVAFVVACGGQSGLLSSNQASTLNAQLNTISSAVASGQCGAASSAVQSFDNQVAALPANVNTTLVKNLGQWATTISDLAARDCSSSSSSSSKSSSSSSSSSSTSSTPTSTTPSSSTSTTPTTSTSSSSSTSSATNPTGTGTNTTNGGVPLGGAGANGGSGAGGNQNGQ